MKKYFFLAAAAVLALAACTKNVIDDSQREAINFSAVAGKTTKAPLTGTTYGTDAPIFGMYAYALASAESGAWTANSTVLSPYMNNVQIKYNTDDKIWEPYDGSAFVTYYWPLSGSLTFVGYSPHMASGVSYATNTKTLTFTDFTQPADTTAQKDLMYAITNPDLHANQSTYTPGGGSLTGVNVQFHHALSQVRFAIKKASGLSGYTITVNSLQFNAYSKGTLNVVNDAPNWGTVNAENLAYPVLSASQVATDSYAICGGRHMPLPQTLTAEQQKFTITYSLATTGGIDLGQKTVSVNLRTDSVSAWAVNTRYTYNIEIDLEKIYFNPTIETDWSNAASQDLNTAN